MKEKTRARHYAKGIGDAVADRTINRLVAHEFRKPKEIQYTIGARDDISIEKAVEEQARSQGYEYDEYRVKRRGDVLDVTIQALRQKKKESWADVAKRVAQGNSLLEPREERRDAEFDALHHHLRQASVLMSGRHLQHGDKDQPNRNIEVFTNCLHGSTEILTQEYGNRALNQMVGEVVTVKSADGTWRPAKINEHGTQELFDITLKTGSSKVRKTVTATANHRWFLSNGEVTENLKVGDVLRPTHADVGIDAEGVVHGIVFGDGTAHKSRKDSYRLGVSSGRTYASIRVCKQDSVADELHEWLDHADYKHTTPSHANGDRVYYLGKVPYIKELPFTRDPEYLAGFIYGWWLADGYKSYGSGLEISTANIEAANWLEEHAAYAGYNVTSHRVMERNEDDGSFQNGKALHVIRLRKNVAWKVESINPVGADAVYCPEEPVTSGFTLANGLLTGNCSTSAVSFLTFYLLLNGSGVGRAYDDNLMCVDWSNLPVVIPVIDESHQDVLSGQIDAFSVRNARHLYAHADIVEFRVPDSREGWAKAIERMEVMAFEGVHRNKVLLLDFSDVRPRGAPIGGMQNRPASGPGPLMDAIKHIARLRDSSMEPWRQAMYADHYLAECVLVGGARRAARMATKTWRDKNVLDFITVKRPLEFLGKSGGEIAQMKQENPWGYMGFLWSSNNSVTADDEFWKLVKATDEDLRFESDETKELALHAKKVLDTIAEASYFDGTGEPGIINQDKLNQRNDGLLDYLDGDFAESERYKLDEDTKCLTSKLPEKVVSAKYTQITNPCGEISLMMLGGYCVIADVVPFHAQDDDDAEDAFRTTTRALIRTNLMDALYGREVKRTNRIGVGITGLHEYAYKRFGYGWKDIVDEGKSKDFWLMMNRFKRAVAEEAERYAKELGVSVPHTDTTIKPAGTTSKLFGLTEGAHLPSMREYLRWVQFRNDDPLIQTYADKGYPVRKLQVYSGTTIVGFPTQPAICRLGMGNKLVTAAEATPEEQYQYLRLLEKYWIQGVDAEGNLLPDSGNQVSYTLKYDPLVVGYEEFRSTLIDGQSSVRCCSVMPQTDATAFEYQPEEPVTKAKYEMIVNAIMTEEEVQEDVGLEHVDCAGGACPVSFNENQVAQER